MSESDARGGTGAAAGGGAELGPGDARALVRAWLAAVGLDLPDGELIPHLQADEFSHAGLQRSARQSHERKLATAAAKLTVAAESLADPQAAAPASLGDAAIELFDARVLARLGEGWRRALAPEAAAAREAA